MTEEPVVYLELIKNARHFAVQMTEDKWDEIRQQPETLALILDRLNYAADHYQGGGTISIPKVSQ